MKTKVKSQLTIAVPNKTFQCSTEIITIQWIVTKVDTIRIWQIFRRPAVMNLSRCILHPQRLTPSTNLCRPLKTKNPSLGLSQINLSKIGLNLRFQQRETKTRGLFWANQILHAHLNSKEQDRKVVLSAWKKLILTKNVTVRPIDLSFLTANL